MENIFTALFPIFTLITLGYLFKRLAFPAEGFWPMADRFTYYVLMPALLIHKLSAAGAASDQALDLVYTGLSAILLVLLLLLILERIFNFDPAAFTSVVQGGIRFNTYVFFALLDSMFGDNGVVLGAILITFTIPLINLLCISVFAVYADSRQISAAGLVRSIMRNPLIIACLLGGFINFAGIPFPLPIEKSFAVLSDAALPLGLLSVGVGLELNHMRAAKLELVIASLTKLVLFPVAIYAIGLLFGLSGVMLAIAVIFGAMPTAISSYILARTLGGDTRLMSSVITLETLLSTLTLALVIATIEPLV